VSRCTALLDQGLHHAVSQSLIYDNNAVAIDAVFLCTCMIEGWLLKLLFTETIELYIWMQEQANAELAVNNGCGLA
jgi:hypothetical protein